MNVLFISLGCDKNLVDSEYMLGALATEGFQICDDESAADIIVINSCAFIHDAKEESINTILSMAEYKKTGRLKVLLVSGCLSQRYKEEVLKEIPEVDGILGTNSYNEIVKAIHQTLDHQKYISFQSLDQLPKLENERILSTPGHYAHLKIAEGCNKNCAYCVIPSIRGPYRSVPMEDLIKSAKSLVASGVKEIILVAQETTLYGVDLYGKKSLHLLLDELNQIPGLYWIRIMYCYPEEIYPELIESMKKDEKVCHYLDMPIQHCSDRVLRAMNRRTHKEELKHQISALRTAMPDICLRTTLIAGFPGELEEDHEQLMEFVNEMEFDRLGVFTYSREEDTIAYSLPNQVDEEVKQTWKDEIMELSEEVIADKNESLIGLVTPVIIEGKVADEETYIGRTFRDAPNIDGYVFINSEEELKTGDFVKIKITASYEYDLIGEVV